MMSVQVEPAWLLGPFQAVDEVAKLEEALPAVFPKCTLRITGGVEGTYILLHGARCTEAGLGGFIRGVLWKKGLDKEATA